MKNLNKKKMILLTVFASLLVLFIGVKMMRSNSISKTGYRKYLLEVDVVTKNTEDVIEEYVYSYYNDGKNSKLTSLDLEKDIYFKKDTGFYEESGKFKVFDASSSYKDINKILSKIKLSDPVYKKDKDREYSVTISKDVMNSILDAIVLGRNTEVEESAYLSLRENKITSFTAHLNGIDGYKTVNINLTYTKLDDDFKIVMPNDYKELHEEVNDDFLRIIKE